MYGITINSLNVYKSETKWPNANDILLSLSGDRRNHWRVEQINFYGNNTSFYITMEGVSGNSYTGDIAFDDISISQGICQRVIPVAEDIDCDFESGLCEWEQAYGDDFDWTRNSGRTSSYSTGPDGDHTTGFGYYVYIETDSREYGDFARLWSPEYQGDGPLCLTFWYHMYGVTINSLNVYKSETKWPNANDILLSLSGDRRNHWRVEQINFYGYNTSFYITMEGVSGNSYTGDIAFDDISISQGICQRVTPVAEDIDCDFESGLCEWEQAYGDDFDWTRNSGRTSSYSTGPDGDHTTGSGYYVYIETNSRSYGDFARLWSPEYQGDGPLCLTFWYHMYGITINSLNVYKSETKWPNANDILLSLSGDRRNHWRVEQINFYGNNTSFYITMEGVSGNSYTGDIAFDDISISQGICQRVIPVAEDIDCDFESGLCEWEQAYGDDFDWTRNSGRTSSYSTGPDGDHTTGFGYYVYIETDSREYGDFARLWSPEYQGDGPLCLTFWYHMYGVTINSLNVYKSETKWPNANDILLSLSGDRRNHWRVEQINFYGYNTSFYITMEGVSGNSYTGDIAFDDISISQGICQRVTPVAEDIDCDFESGLCEWEQAYGDDFDWTRNSGRTSSYSTGPDGDHTTGSGYYVYIETNSRSYGDFARLWSPEYQGEGPLCLTFWYHMYGITINSLNVYKSETKWPNANDILLSLSGDRRNHWRVEQINFYGYNTSFYITMEGVSGNGYTGDIAFDDISISQGICQRVTPVAEDIDCDFESGLCEWEQAYGDDFDWTRNSGRTSSSSTGPDGDHTTGFQPSTLYLPGCQSSQSSLPGSI
ncbi:MAM and LDL-receptor class A domain-containing protein 1-like [Diadema antillarum]|uniref:MAM and LDL-receptor class A domain-containing protein 1-like n=1 Tax=Diadema antillarum TaxID=105358 RepID=UPI003A8B2748